MLGNQLLSANMRQFTDHSALNYPQLTKGMKHNYAGVVERLERVRAPLDYAWGVMSHLKNVKDSGPFRDAYRELQV